MCNSNKNPVIVNPTPPPFLHLSSRDIRRTKKVLKKWKKQQKPVPVPKEKDAANNKTEANRLVKEHPNSINYNDVVVVILPVDIEKPVVLYNDNGGY